MQNFEDGFKITSSTIIFITCRFFIPKVATQVNYSWFYSWNVIGMLVLAQGGLLQYLDHVMLKRHHLNFAN